MTKPKSSTATVKKRPAKDRARRPRLPANHRDVAPAFDATPADVRAWVRKRGDTIGAHGCISDDVRDAYNKVHRSHQFAGSHPSTQLG